MKPVTGRPKQITKPLPSLSGGKTPKQKDTETKDPGKNVKGAKKRYISSSDGVMKI